ncbi:MAG: hypothetical protein BZ138_08460, partial [Methanosphaera sp. rholeuAM270]
MLVLHSGERVDVGLALGVAQAVLGLAEAGAQLEFLADLGIDIVESQDDVGLVVVLDDLGGDHLHVEGLAFHQNPVIQCEDAVFYYRIDDFFLR